MPTIINFISKVYFRGNAIINALYDTLLSEFDLKYVSKKFYIYI